MRRSLASHTRHQLRRRPRSKVADNIVTIVVAILGSGAFSTLVSAIVNDRAKKRESASGEQAALRLLMKDRLRFLCVRYIHQGWIYEDELEDLIEMHGVYHNQLKGNGYLDTLMGKVKALEVRGVGV